ncbi:V-type ATP synthase subunit E [Deinococcus peraridilitoris]|uniref:V-type proton ATPase subunit E n=1 Tax=Deinococcus peraridilitoris (strain DSM 19664 / LMG 22246 / CIP 109416 / KR-200) TaxID=937777 RepID=L0A1Q6_DEIPD|nr:V-type ATP synthase subunit E [Deinococcus peraridilitoris]AFZ67833.1 archaeal/vacuolar-type H+-ATPase subunit E [Deinococcus peraridilitoris DSM 19664]
MRLDTILENEARAEIEQIRAEGRARAQEIIRAAQERAQAQVESQKRTLDGQLQAGLVRARSGANLEVSAARLSASDTGLQRAFDLAAEQLRGVTSAPEYREILSRLISEVRSTLGTVEAIEVNPREAAIAREVAPDLEVRENPAIEGGVRGITRGGKSGVTNTLLGRLARVRESIAPQVARMLAE